jgi:hypothetical protein
MGICDMIQCPKILEDDAGYEGNSKFYQKKKCWKSFISTDFKEGFILKNVVCPQA